MKTIEEALNYLKNITVTKEDAGKTFVVDDDFYYLVKASATKDLKDCKFESHKKYIDIQYIVDGHESFGLLDVCHLTANTEYNGDKDIMYYEKPNTDYSVATLSSGDFITFYPHDGHMPGIKVGESSVTLKVIGKLKVQ